MTPSMIKRGFPKYFHGLFIPSLLLVIFLSGCQEPPPEEKTVIRPVRAMQVADTAQVSRRSFPGRARAAQQVDLSFRVAGPLITFPVNIGDEVAKGDILARIDPQDYEVNLRNVKGQLEEAKAVLQRAQSDYDRLLRVFKEDPGATSEAAIDQARQTRDSAQANVASLEASVQAAADQLEYATLKAPFAGTVVATYVENFEHVQARQRIVRLLDPSLIEMVVDIPENLISLAPYVETVYVVFDPFPDHKLAATIKEIGREASQTTRTYPVTLIMEQPEEVTILPGMAGKTVGAEGKLPTEQGQAQGLVIPVSATFTGGEANNQTFVWIIDEETGTISRRQVTVGELTDSGIRILSGLEVGEWIATAGVHYLREGQQVKILPEGTPS